MTIEITADEARELLARAVEEKGADYVYQKPRDSERCVYFFDGAPSCLIGHVLSYKGWDAASLDGSDNDTSIEDLAEHGLLTLDAPTLDALALAQTEQDHGGTWGTAVAVALLRLDKEDRS